MKFTTDFTTINEDIRKAITKELKSSLDATPILISKYSNHPDDHYLYLYVAESSNGYISGLANVGRNYGVGLYENHYNCTFEIAMKIMADKIHDCNKGGI